MIMGIFTSNLFFGVCVCFFFFFFFFFVVFGGGGGGGEGGGAVVGEPSQWTMILFKFRRGHQISYYMDWLSFE